MTKRRSYQDLGDVELPAKVSERVDRIIEQAESELEEARVNFRWGREQLEVVKQAAQLMGVPYQTFIKLAVYEHALTILEKAKSAKPDSAA